MSAAYVQPDIVTRAVMHSAVSRHISGGEVSVFSTPSPAKSTENEDALLVMEIDDRRVVLAVADGLGGQRAGAQAAQVAIQMLATCIEHAVAEDILLRAAILNGFEQANYALLDLGTGGGTTLAIVEIEEDLVRPYHVGDSSIVVMGQRGKVKLQTLAHSPVAYAVEAGLLDEEEAMHHAERHLVSNIVGSPEMRIEIGPTLRLASRDTVLLASDGLFDNLRLPEIVDLCRKGSIEDAAASMLAEVQQRMSSAEPGRPSKPDDLSFMVYRPHS